MRTTISIQDTLLQKAKEVAHQRKYTLGDVIETALAQSLPELKSKKQKQKVGWTTFKGNGLMPGVNLDSNADLQEILDGE